MHTHTHTYVTEYCHYLNAEEKIHKLWAEEKHRVIKIL